MLLEIGIDPKESFKNQILELLKLKLQTVKFEDLICLGFFEKAGGNMEFFLKISRNGPS